ncbi:MAG: ATP synthase F1 subunit gamma [Bacteroidales bacterium]|nr:ATP synthase F1 subunit gamma [Bacteroidales bacterium]
MSNLKEVRIRIASVKSTQQITSAMKMVAASKLRRAQNAILKLRPYARKLGEILRNLSSGTDAGPGMGSFADQREVKNVLLVVLSSNRGLCGAFNSNVIRMVNSLTLNEYKTLNEKGRLSIITIGKKATDYYSKRGYNVVDHYDHFWDAISFDSVAGLAEKLMGDFATKKYDRIEIIYNQFKNAAVHDLIREQFLPVLPAEEKQTGAKHFQYDYIFEPGREEIILDLIPKSLRMQLYKAVLDSNAAEHGARMTAMHQATDNARELLKELKLTYNKARQAAITNELLEIVSGAEALKG